MWRNISTMQNSGNESPAEFAGEFSVFTELELASLWSCFSEAFLKSCFTLPCTKDQGNVAFRSDVQLGVKHHGESMAQINNIFLHYLTCPNVCLNIRNSANFEDTKINRIKHVGSNIC